MGAKGEKAQEAQPAGVVELEEGARVDARIEGVDCARPEDIKVGMLLKVKYLHREEGGKKRPVWRLNLSSVLPFKTVTK